VARLACSEVRRPYFLLYLEGCVGKLGVAINAAFRGNMRDFGLPSSSFHENVSCEQWCLVVQNMSFHNLCHVTIFALFLMASLLRIIIREWLRKIVVERNSAIVYEMMGISWWESCQAHLFWNLGLKFLVLTWHLGSDGQSLKSWLHSVAARWHKPWVLAPTSGRSSSTSSSSLQGCCYLPS